MLLFSMSSSRREAPSSLILSQVCRRRITSGGGAPLQGQGGGGKQKERNRERERGKMDVKSYPRGLISGMTKQDEIDWDNRDDKEYQARVEEVPRKGKPLDERFYDAVEDEYLSKIGVPNPVREVTGVARLAVSGVRRAATTVRRELRPQVLRRRFNPFKRFKQQTRGPEESFLSDNVGPAADARRAQRHEQMLRDMQLEKRAPQILEKLRDLTEDDLVHHEVQRAKCEARREYNRRVRDLGFHHSRELRETDDIALEPAQVNAIREKVHKDWVELNRAAPAVFEEQEKAIRKLYPGGSSRERVLDGADFSGERTFASSLTKEQDEDIVLMAAWERIKPSDSLMSIDEKIDNSKQVWEKPILPPGKERDDSVALYEFGIPSFENTLSPITINGYCPVEVEDPKDYLTYTQIERRPKELPFQGCEWSLVPSLAKNSTKMRASVRLVF